jgi:hypothetical protein
MKNNFDAYIWCCDYNNYRGEGILARLFVEYLSKYKKKIVIKTFNNEYVFSHNRYKIKSKLSDKKKINLNLFEKYLYPIFGLLWLWKKYFEKKEIIYLNFNPLWNILIFIFSPPGTSFGPITGSIYSGNARNISGIVRKYFFPILYKIGLFFLFKRKKKILFSTSLLKKIVPKKKISRCIFDFQIFYFKQLNKDKKILKKKDIDLVYYNRNHLSKHNKVIIEVLKEISKKYNVIIVGDYLDEKNVKNLRIIKKKKLNEILSDAKFTFSAPENVFSMFTLECLSLQTKIFYDNKQKIINKFFSSKNLIPFNSNNFDQTLNIVNKHLKKKFNFGRIGYKKNFWDQKIKEFNEFFLNC